MKVIKDLFYTNDHDWVKVEGDQAFIGLTDFAQDALGDIVYVELPEVDDEIAKEDVYGAVESVKAAQDLFMPIDGLVVEVNEDLLDDPSLLNSDPYENWIVKVSVTDKGQLDELLTSEDYEKLLDEEA